MMRFLNQKYRELARVVFPTLVAGFSGLFVTMAMWHLTAEAEHRQYEIEFAGRANNHRTVLQRGIDDYWDSMYAVRAFFDASETINRGQFEDFAKSLLKDRPAILNLAWLHRVKHDQRAVHESEGVRDGLPNYRIRAIAPDGSLPAAPKKDEYFPKFYSTEDRNSRVYGLDNMDGGIRQQTVYRIRDGNLLSTSPPIVLHIGKGDRRGFWAGIPVYARGQPHETVEDRRRNITGIVQGVFQVGVMIDTILGEVKSPVRLYLYPPGASGSDPPIYSKSRFDHSDIEARSQSQLAADMHRSYPIDMGDRQWTAMITPDPGAPATADHHKSSTIVLICGLLFTSGLVAFVAMTRRYTRKIEAARENIETQNMRFDAALNNMTQGLLMYDHRGRLSVTNKRMADLFGMPWERWKTLAIGTTPQESLQVSFGLTSVGMKNPSQVLGELQAILESKKPGRIVFERNNGRTYSSLCSPMADGGFVVTFNDFTERRRAEEKISHMAHYDTLTDLANRAYFQEKLDALLAGIPVQTRFAVFSLDLDHFKTVNDTLGHLAGDKLLQAVAARMRACVRDSDSIARLGGDEFAVLQVPSEQIADATSLAKRLIASVSAPYQIDGHEVIIGVSIGIAIAPADGATSQQLMKKADKALYRSKGTGGNSYRFVSEEFARKNLQLSPPTSGRHRANA